MRYVTGRDYYSQGSRDDDEEHQRPTWYVLEAMGMEGTDKKRASDKWRNWFSFIQNLGNQIRRWTQLNITQFRVLTVSKAFFQTEPFHNSHEIKTQEGGSVVFGQDQVHHHCIVFAQEGHQQRSILHNLGREENLLRTSRTKWPSIHACRSLPPPGSHGTNLPNRPHTS